MRTDRAGVRWRLRRVTALTQPDLHPVQTDHLMRTIRPLVARRSAAAVSWVMVLSLAGAGAVQACGYHDPSGISLGMLNWAYPDALHVRTAVWMAQRDGVLAKAEPPEPADPASAAFKLQQLARYRETHAQLEVLRSRIEIALGSQPFPEFSIVLIGPMLWTRFERGEGGLGMQSHAVGPARDDVVIVTDAPVTAALAEGRMAPREARERGLARLYGSPEAVERVSAVLDSMVPALQAQAVQQRR